MSSFLHGGNSGDVIYALPTVRALGGGTVYLAPSEFAHKPFDQSDLDNIKPLLMAQPYIENVKLWTGQAIRYDLDTWRRDARIYERTFMPLVERYARPFIASEFTHEFFLPWLTVDHEPMPGDVAIARSSRRHNARFPWAKVLRKYSSSEPLKNRCQFLGSIEERDSLKAEFGNEPVWYYGTPTLLHLAQVIAGARLFIGNASCPEAIAEGLGVRKIVEVDPMFPHIISRRPGADYVCGSHIDLPDL